MNRLVTIRLALPLAAGFFFLPAHPTAALTREFDETYSVGSERRLVVDAAQIEVSVTGTDRPDIAMRMIWDAKTNNEEKAEERFARLRFEPRQTEKETVLALEAKKSGGGWFWGKRGRVPDVRMELQVPRDLHLHIDTTSGVVTVRSVNGNHTVDTTSADIRLEDSAGNHRLDSTSGQVRLLGCPGNHHADTTSGDIQIEGGAGDVFADSTSGDIRIIDFPGAHRADTTSGDIHATLAAELARDLNFDSVSGDIRLIVPATVAAQWDLETVSGDLDFALPEAEIERRTRDELVARTGDGTRRVRAETVSGNISIKPAERAS